MCHLFGRVLQGSMLYVSSIWPARWKGQQAFAYRKYLLAFAILFRNYYWARRQMEKLRWGSFNYEDFFNISVELINGSGINYGNVVVVSLAQCRWDFECAIPKKPSLTSLVFATQWWEQIRYFLLILHIIIDYRNKGCKLVIMYVCCPVETHDLIRDLLR